MEAADRSLLLSFAAAQRLGSNPEALVQSWERQLESHPGYLSRWLATATLSDPDAVRQLLAELGWWPGPRPPKLSDPGGTRREAALQRLRRAVVLFRQEALGADEEQRFGARFAALSEASEGLLWKRSSDATFWALCRLLGLNERPPPEGESPWSTLTEGESAP